MTTILIIDDEQIVRELLEEALRSPDRTILCAADFAGALSHAHALDSLDLAMVDKNLEGTSGLELVRQLRLLHPHAEYIIMTAFASLDSAVESVRLGLYDYIQKPFDIGQLEARVTAAIAKVHTRRDVAQQHQATADRLAHTEAYDQLTGLLNRTAFIGRVDRLLRAAREAPASTFAVLVLDLNDFGRINDSYGPSAGDQILVQWGRRLIKLVRANDAVARVGADLFAILLEGVRGTEGALTMVERIHRALDDPFELGDRPVTLRASIGISLSREQYARGEDLLRDAGTALVEAKSAGKSSHAIFVTEMHSAAVAELSLDQGIRQALNNHELTTWYQPILSVDTERIVGFEALARWQHPERGLLSPAAFLERARDAGFLAEISWQVLQQAFAQHRQWLTQFGDEHPLAMNVNVAPPLLLRPGFVDELARLIAELALPPARLKAEVTEIVAIDNTELSAAVIQEIRRLGVAVCLDDFGTGYASLSWLHRFPVDELKIDQTFIAGMTHDRRSHILVGAAVGLAHSLGLPVVAEGVETEAQFDALRALAVEYAQGFLFARPCPPEQIGELIAAAPGARERPA